MFPKHDFNSPAFDATDMGAMRDELREIARHLRALAQPRVPDLLADQIRAQMERIQLPRAA